MGRYDLFYPAKTGKITLSSYIKYLLLQNLNSIQILTKVKEKFPNISEKKARQLIAVLKSQYRQLTT